MLHTSGAVLACVRRVRRLFSNGPRAVFGVAIAAALTLFGPAPFLGAAAAQSVTYCSPGQDPSFTDAMQPLVDALGSTIGTPQECEHTDPLSGTVRQQTTTGVAYYDPQTGAPSFTDGVSQWSLADDGSLVSSSSTGAGAAPANARSGATAAPVDPCASYLPYDGPDDACVLTVAEETHGAIDVSPGLRAYRYDVAASGTHLSAQLTDLPADMDLYVVDPANQVIAQSVLDGTAPRSVDTTFGDAGPYFVYVVLDASRSPGPPGATYTLDVSVQTPAPDSPAAVAPTPTVVPVTITDKNQFDVPAPDPATVAQPAPPPPTVAPANAPCPVRAALGDPTLEIAGMRFELPCLTCGVPNPPPQPTHTPTSTPTHTPTVTSTPTSTPTNTPTRTPTPTWTPMPAQDVQPSTVPTAVPTSTPADAAMPTTTPVGAPTATPTPRPPRATPPPPAQAGGTNDATTAGQPAAPC